MNNIVLISHSEALAKTVLQFVQEMMPQNTCVRLSYVAGGDNGQLGNSYTKIAHHLKQFHKQQEPVLLFCDLGSAVTTTALVIANEGLDPKSIQIARAPFLEGVLTAYGSWTTDNIKTVRERSEQTLEKNAREHTL